MRGLSLVLCVLGLLVSAPVSAQFNEPAGGEPPAGTFVPSGAPLPSWGITTNTIEPVGAWSFVPFDSAAVMAFDNTSGFRYVSSGAPTSLWSPVALPAGTLIAGVEILGCDSTPSAQITLLPGRQYVSNMGVPVFETIGSSLGTGLAFEGGCGAYYFDLSASAHVVANAQAFYGLRITFTGNGPTLQLAGVRVYYRRLVSPAPMGATFADVAAGSALHQYVEALVAAGVTSGCGGGNFCPNDPVTRGQMAVFLAKALGLHWPN